MSSDADEAVSPELLAWADIIFVMERAHRTKLIRKYRPPLKVAKNGARPVIVAITPFPTPPLRLLILAVLGALVLGCGTRDDLVWKAQIYSPDRVWLAKADTVQNGGFGGAEIHTTVFLERENAKVAPQEVLVAQCDGPMPHPYTLDNDANKGGCIGLTMTWPTSKHLHLTYEARQGTNVAFKAVRVGDVDITVTPVVGGTPPKSSPYWRQSESSQGPH